MSVRGVRVYRRSDVQSPPAIILEKNGSDGALLLQNSAILYLDSESFEVEKRSYTKVLDGYGILGVLRIATDESVLVIVTGIISVGQLNGVDILKITNCEFIPLKTIGNAEYADPRIIDLQRLLCSGMFYFSSSSHFDITCSAQRRAANLGSDNRFFWNRCLQFAFLRFGIDTDKWLLKCVAGSVLVRTVYVGHRTGRVALISRLSCERVGTRFNVRGANYLGHVANFVETEQLITFDDRECSLIQIRGSIPLFWEQPGVQVGSHKVKLRAFEASIPAYHRHITFLRDLYGDVTIVNLLGSKEGERMLSDAFKTQHKKSKLDSAVDFIDFDYHSQIRSSKESINLLRKKLVPYMSKYGAYVASQSSPARSQLGVIRTNCLDCLDRTNCVQTLIGLHMVKEQVQMMSIDGGKVNIEQRIEEILRDLWQKNGDQCSTIYAGTGALDGKNKLKDASRSIARTIQNNLMDGSKQESFDLFLSGCAIDQKILDTACNLLPTKVMQEYADAVSQLVERREAITDLSPITVFVGTWNVNGGKNIQNIAFRSEASLSNWIFPNSNLVLIDDVSAIPDVVAIGVEELVDLNASNMVKASTTNQRLWCDAIRKTLHEKAPYIFLASEQLVGVCLFLFIRPHIAPAVKDFAVASVKTGMGGATGNKGSVAFRIVLNSTSICFICSHFAAGQNEVKDRNEDFWTAMRKIRFPQGRSVESHDVLFWFGDFNYRINMSGDDVKRAVSHGDYSQLIANDQLKQQREQGLTFVNFEEGALNFAPTYKYDTFSDDYDTSEKCRTPAWTDRILWCEKRSSADTRLLSYYRSELKTSDHRPVAALFSVSTHKVVPNKCISLVEDVINCMGPPDATIICTVAGHQRFPFKYYSVIVEKLREISAVILASKFEKNQLWIVLESGESALAALSMDDIPLSTGGERLTVALRSPEWSDCLSISTNDFEVDDFSTAEEDISSVTQFEFEDDEEVASMNSLGLSATAPDRPRPPSTRSENTASNQYTNIGWPDDDTSVSPFSQSLPPHRNASFNSFQTMNASVHPFVPVRSESNLLRSASAVPVIDDRPPIVPSRSAPAPPPRPAVPVIPPRPKGW